MEPITSMPAQEESRDGTPRLVAAVEELLLVATAVAVAVISILFGITSLAVHKGLHDVKKKPSAYESHVPPAFPQASSGSPRASAAVGGGTTAGTGVTPPATGTPPSGAASTTEEDKCKTPIDPEKTSLAEALGCMAAAIAGGIAGALFEAFEFIYLLYVCFIIPVVALILAWIAYPGRQVPREQIEELQQAEKVVAKAVVLGQAGSLLHPDGRDRAVDHRCDHCPHPLHRGIAVAESACTAVVTQVVVAAAVWPCEWGRPHGANASPGVRVCGQVLTDLRARSTRAAPTKGRRRSEPQRGPAALRP